MSATFDNQMFDHLKELCRLDCDPEEEAELVKRIGTILEFVAQLDEVDTEHVAPYTNVALSLVGESFQEETMEELMPHAAFLANAPDQIAGMVRIPPILKAQ